MLLLHQAERGQSRQLLQVLLPRRVHPRLLLQKNHRGDSAYHHLSVAVAYPPAQSHLLLHLAAPYHRLRQPETARRCLLHFRQRLQTPHSAVHPLHLHYHQAQADLFHLLQAVQALLHLHLCLQPLVVVHRHLHHSHQDATMVHLLLPYPHSPAAAVAADAAVCWPISEVVPDSRKSAILKRMIAVLLQFLAPKPPRRPQPLPLVAEEMLAVVWRVRWLMRLRRGRAKSAIVVSLGLGNAQKRSVLI